MKISQISKKDIDYCGFLLKLLKVAKYEIDGSGVKDIHDTYAWVHQLSVAFADGWNEENLPAVEKQDDGMKNIKITQSLGS